MQFCWTILKSRREWRKLSLIQKEGLINRQNAQGNGDFHQRASRSCVSNSQGMPKSAHNAIQHFWFGKISCTKQKSLASTILDKSRVFNGELTNQSNLRASKDF